MRIQLLFLKIFILLKYGSAYDLFPLNHVYQYELQTNVTILPDEMTSFGTNWTLNGILTVQRNDVNNISFQFNLTRSRYRILDSVKSLSSSFRMIFINDESITLHSPRPMIELPITEPVWSANIKRGIVSLLQLDGDANSGAFVSHEFGLFGVCPTEFFISNQTDGLSASKIYNMDQCQPFYGGIFKIRSNLPLNYCLNEHSKPAQAISSRLANFKLKNNSKLYLSELDAEMRTNVQASESYDPQFIYTKITMSVIKEEPLTDENKIMFDDVPHQISEIMYDFPVSDATGGRNKQSASQMVKRTNRLLISLAESLENVELQFEEPYQELVSETMRMMENMDLQTLNKLYDEINIGTSTIQETVRNLFLEILPRTGTTHTVLLTKNLVVNKYVRPTTAVQLLISLPFFITELSFEMVKECEAFLTLGHDRPDVKHAAVLSYATIINKAFKQGVLNVEQFEKYVKTFFDLFLNSFDYELQMLYLEALGNLQLGNVANYLEPIIKADYAQNTDIRFLAILALLPTAHTRAEKVFEIYWPIFQSQSTPLQLRVAALLMLFSNPTPGRLLGLYNVIKEESCPHIINFYRTTVLSLSETTYSCYQPLRRLISYMRRHLPEEPPKKYWMTGNYIFDYKDRKFDIGSMLQTLLIGDAKKDLPLVISMRFNTEALGRFTGQLGVYIKARGLSDAVMDRMAKITAEDLKIEQLAKILKLMKLTTISSTPLHLEFIIKFEEKSVLSFHVNQTNFYNLTEGNLLNRINSLLKTDSYVNLQIVRRPFMIKHSLATLLGTPADILIESTFVSSLRGSTTQQLALDKITRNNRVDVRYSSNAVAKIRSYNPIEDIEYATIREQGFLVFLPLNNEIILNISAKTITFSFYRTETITSGVSFKSRSRNYPANQEVAPLAYKPIINNQLNLEDIGIIFDLSFHEKSSKKNLVFMLEADILNNAKVFTKAPYSAMQHLLSLISLMQLNTVHIGRDKHFTILLTNQPKSKIEGHLKFEIEDHSNNPLAKENQVTKLDFSLMHLLNYNDPENAITLHKWEFSSRHSSMKNSKTLKTMISVHRKTASGDKWKMCVTSSLDPLIFMKKSMHFNSNIVFGSYNSSMKKCPIDKSRIDVNFNYGCYKDTEEFHAPAEKNDSCTNEIIRFSPPPYTKQCNSDKYKYLTSITNYDLRLKFERIPDAVKNILVRIDHLFTAFLPTTVENLFIADGVKLSVKMPLNEEDTTQIVINNVTTKVPFSYYLNAKYHIDETLINYGTVSSCSIINDKISTFDHKLLQLNDHIKQNFTFNDEILMAGDCSESPKLAVFVTYKQNSTDFKQVKIYVGGNTITIQASSDGIPIIEYEGQSIDVRNGSIFQHEVMEDFYDFKISQNDENIVEVENILVNTKIQYNMQNILSIILPTIHKGKSCAICNYHKNSGC